MTNGKTVKERLATLETKVDDIMNNHLHSIERKINWIFTLIITTLIGIVSLLLNVIL